MLQQHNVINNGELRFVNAVYEGGGAVTGLRVAVMIKRRSAPPNPWPRDSWQVIGVVANSQPPC